MERVENLSPVSIVPLATLYDRFDGRYVANVPRDKEGSKTRNLNWGCCTERHFVQSFEQETSNCCKAGISSFFSKNSSECFQCGLPRKSRAG